MNFARFRAFEAQRPGRSTSSLSASGQAIAAVRLDPDLLFDTLSTLLNHLGASAAPVIAWMQHEDPHALAHHPWEIAATIAWAGGFYLLSLCVRMIARVLRQQRAPSRPKTSATD